MLRTFKVSGLLAGQSFNWNGRNYRPLDTLLADMDTTDPEALRHLLSPEEGGYNDSLVARQVVTEVSPESKPETKKASKAQPEPNAEQKE